MTSPGSKLFTSVGVGAIKTGHRVVLAPLTRYKADKEHVPYLPLVKEYYTQRGSTPGTLLITEGTYIAAKAGGYAHVPGIWSKAQIAAWKEITDSVHAQGSFIFLQLWSIGRAADPAQLLSEDPTFSYVSASDVGYTSRPDGPLPRPLTIEEIKEYVELYAQGAANAIEAGFDGVEVHSANGYLPDQFIQDVTNKRTDDYGGSIENRSRFVLEIVEAVVKRVGAQRTGIRLSPWGHFGEMGMKDPIPQFSHVISSLAAAYQDPPLAYLHLVEPRVHGNITRDPNEVGAHESNLPFRKLWRGSGRVTLLAGAFTKDIANQTLEAEEDETLLVVFGRHFISNPDLPVRLQRDIPLTPYNRETFYLVGENSPRGYTDPPFASQEGN
ncbi:Oxidored-FMN domain-containing protein [Mycena indigotica]|uniref:Oxidored-FMN domain-containing protein n=1 Tax=Mycena indigotica TaxID=2126181 RepID=A0A8H6S0N1_9AGAR|nr:Oxidored-FMN domain-containing protein [Mycena indigotica]KAF7291155.1 Oxidored-FMN domain-containing protein [Mycena indigotica]